MKFDEYELICYECGGADFERQFDIRDEWNVDKSRAERKLEFWAISFHCTKCKEWRAFSYRKDPRELKLRQRQSSVRAIVKLSHDAAESLRLFWRNEMTKMNTRARIYLMRHGRSPARFAETYGGVTARAAKEFLQVAQEALTKLDAKRMNTTREVLELQWRQEAIDFYMSIIQDPATWARDPKVVMQARRELSALQGLAADTGQVNVNLNDNRSQVTVYQLALPDDGRTRLPPPKDDVKVIECQPNKPQS